jgi:N-acyl-D-aspartate/D-glutamate deacylase
MPLIVSVACLRHPALRKEQKEVSVAKKTKFRRNFATIQEAVQLWEKLRPKSTSQADKEQLVEQIVGMVGCMDPCMQGVALQPPHDGRMH